MSRIGKLPVEIPQGVSVDISGSHVKTTGPKGTLERYLPREVSVKVEGGRLFVEIKKENDRAKAMHGTTRAILANDVKGVTEAWVKNLELVGTGYRAEVSGKTLSLLVGFSHPVKFEAQPGITFRVEKTDVFIEGADKELVGQVAAKIRAARPPEPYKGKGIKYKDEVIRRKAGKAAKAMGGE